MKIDDLIAWVKSLSKPLANEQVDHVVRTLIATEKGREILLLMLGKKV